LDVAIVESVIIPISSMRSRFLFLFLAGSLMTTVAAAQQTLVCPTAPAGRACDAYHFHVAMYRPDAKQFVEISGANSFATPAACDRARELHVATNTRVVDYLTSVKQKHEADRVGPCHCDMTADKSSPTFLADAQRTMQLRTAEEIRLRVRERLLDNKLTSESELVKLLWNEPPVTPLLAAPKLTSMPQNGPVTVLTAPEELRATKTLDTTKPVIAAMDLPLVDLSAPVAEAAAAPPSGAPPASGGENVSLATTSAAEAAAAPQEPPVEEVPVEPTVQPSIETHVEAATEEDVQSAEETAEKFVSYETQRIQNVLRAAGAIGDENVKSKIFEAAMQRIQLLSNLRLLIEGSGMRSTLAAAARDAQGENERLALIGRLFGDSIKPHWAPQDAADVIFEIDPAIAAEPERALRDTTGRVSLEQKKRALYLVLAHTQPTEDQRLWLSSIVEGFLR
jgi:hypothetical protein